MLYTFHEVTNKLPILDGRSAEGSMADIGNYVEARLGNQLCESFDCFGACLVKLSRQEERRNVNVGKMRDEIKAA